MRKQVLSIILATMFSNMATAEVTAGTCGEVCIMPLPEFMQCDAYIPEGWDDVPEGNTPTYSHVIETQGFYIRDGIWYRELIIVTEPEIVDTEDQVASNMILYNGKLMSQEAVEADVSRVFCDIAMTS